MKYTLVRLSDLKTFTDCMTAIQSIEDNPVNVIGGWDSWISGRETFLLRGAARKIAAIYRKAAKL